MTNHAYEDRSRPVDERVDDLIGLMDIDEKTAQLGAVRFPDLIVGGRLDAEAVLRAVPHGIGQVTRIGATTGTTTCPER